MYNNERNARMHKKIRGQWADGYWNLNKVELIFAPINFLDNHWNMIVIDVNKRTIIQYDSLNDGIASGRNKRIRQDIMYLCLLFFLVLFFNF